MDKIQKAKTLLILDHPFFGTLVSRLPLIEDKSVQTAATNGLDIRYNPDWLLALTVPEIMGVLAHEVMHIANGHTWRRDERDMRQWNVACDYAINPLLVANSLTLPKGALLDARFKDMAAEQIFNKLPSQAQSSPQTASSSGDKSSSAGESASPAQATQGDSTANQNDPGCCGGVTDTPVGEQPANKTEWKTAVAEAAMAAKRAGTLSGDLKRFVDSVLQPKVPWQVLLRDFVELAARNDYNWVRPNARHMQRGFVLPSLLSESLPEVVIACDTSGSITSNILQQFAAEVSAILEQYDTTITILYCDTSIKEVQTVTREDLPLTLNAKGGGGTLFDAPFDWVEKNGQHPACLIYLTDGMGACTYEQPDYPVIWAMTSSRYRRPPFGEVVSF